MKSHAWKKVSLCLEKDWSKKRLTVLWHCRIPKYPDWAMSVQVSLGPRKFLPRKLSEQIPWAETKKKINKRFKIKPEHNLIRFTFLECRWVVAICGQYLECSYSKQPHCFHPRVVRILSNYPTPSSCGSTTSWSVPSFIISTTRTSTLFKSIFLMQPGPLLNLHCKFSRLSQEQSVGLQYIGTNSGGSKHLPFHTRRAGFPQPQRVRLLVMSAQPCNPELAQGYSASWALCWRRCFAVSIWYVRKHWMMNCN